MSGEPDELLQRVLPMNEYEDVRDPRERHRDWVVVRTALTIDKTDLTDEQN